MDTNNYGDPLTLNSPEFAYIYPGISSLGGNVKDSATNQPAFQFRVQNGWNFRIFVLGDKYERVRHDDKVCGWTTKYDPYGEVCNGGYDPETGRFHYYFISTWYEWVKRTSQTDLPGLEGGTVLPEAWVLDQILFDGSLTDAVTIPVYQALPILEP